jgi:hypothetical protein
MGATVYRNLLVPVYPDYPSASVFGIPALNSLMRKRLHSMTSVYVNGLFQFSGHNMRGGFTERAR